MSTQDAPTTAVECTPSADGDRRVFRILDRGPASQPRWHMQLTGDSLNGRSVGLPLAGARVTHHADAWTLASDSANGGVRVRIEARGNTSTLDVFVNYELEVNVWRDLQPDVDRMNTDGPQLMTCRVLSEPDSMPYHPS
jgi:hypothetical protein